MPRGSGADTAREAEDCGRLVRSWSGLGQIFGRAGSEVVRDRHTDTRGDGRKGGKRKRGVRGRDGEQVDDGLSCVM